jgi:hypothetical protein
MASIHPLAQFSHVVLLVMSGTFPMTGSTTQRQKQNAAVTRATTASAV